MRQLHCRRHLTRATTMSDNGSDVQSQSSIGDLLHTPCALTLLGLHPHRLPLSSGIHKLVCHAWGPPLEDKQDYCRSLCGIRSPRWDERPYRMCVLCHNECDCPFGHNPQPILDKGKCCKVCNAAVVRPIRIAVTWALWVAMQSWRSAIAFKNAQVLAANEEAAKREAAEAKAAKAPTKRERKQREKRRKAEGKARREAAVQTAAAIAEKEHANSVAADSALDQAVQVTEQNRTSGASREECLARLNKAMAKHSIHASPIAKGRVKEVQVRLQSDMKGIDGVEVTTDAVKELASVGNITGRDAAPESTIGGETTCIVCFMNPKTHLAAPCGHQCVCGPCAAKLTTCPCCRDTVVMWVKPYLV